MRIKTKKVMKYDETYKKTWIEFFKSCEKMSTLASAKQKLDEEMNTLKSSGVDLSEEEMESYETLCIKTQTLFEKLCKKVSLLETKLEFQNEKKFLDYYLN